MNLAKPYFPIHELPEVAALANDPSVNVLLNVADNTRGRGFLELLDCGLTEAALAVFLDMAELTTIVEAYSQHALENPNLVSLISRRNTIHHRLLSLPPDSVTMLDPTSPHALSHTIYEVCRLGAIIHASAILYVLPPSTGCPRRLVLQVQKVVESVQFERMSRNEVNCFIWVLFLTGVAAQNMPERSWFVERLKHLLFLAAISRWSEMKNIVVSFLWSSSVCDEGGMDLWDTVATDF